MNKALIVTALLTISIILSGCGAGTVLSGDPPAPFTVVNNGLGIDTSNVLVNPFFNVAFTEAVDQQSAAQNIKLTDLQGNTVPIRVVTAGYTAGVFTVNELNFEKIYTLTVSNIRSEKGATLQNAYTVTFITEKMPFNFKITLISANKFSSAQIQTVIQNLSGVATGQLWFAASCKEDGYPNLSTSLEVGRGGFAINEALSSPFNYSSGFSYFTGNPVRCSFSGEDRLTKRRVIIVNN